jgi:hypothetical protein
MSESFLQEIGADASALIAKVKNFLSTNPVAEAVVSDVDAAWEQAKQIVERNGGQLLLSLATNVVPDLLTTQWGKAVADLVSDVKAAGAVTIPAEENIAASLALQTAAAIAGVQPNIPVSAAAVSPNGASTAPGTDATPDPNSTSGSSAGTSDATA